MMWRTAALLLGGITAVNFVFAVIILFFEQKDPKSIWAWLLLLFLLPGVGFVFYLLFGNGLHRKKLFGTGRQEGAAETLRRQRSLLKSGRLTRDNPQLERWKGLLCYHLDMSGAQLFSHSGVDILTDGNEKFDALLSDLASAEHFIHIQYYIIRNDALFYRLLEVLKEKATQGVCVRILYDGMGCRNTPRSFWRTLEQSGIRTAEFFPAFLGRLQLRFNYRNHRKIVVIDDRVGYVGGFNIGKEYVDLDDGFGHWRDTHLRLTGDGVAGLQRRFLLDWNYAAGEQLTQEECAGCKALSGRQGQVLRSASSACGCALQVVSSGPDCAVQQIRDTYLRLICGAKKRIDIQTPYFIPDEAVLCALLVAVRSGVEVRLMIPCKPDHPFVYWATLSYAGQLLEAGAKVFTYENGFLHSKGLVVDTSVFCYGTANLDIRSFALNFEVNVIVYDRQKAAQMEQIFERDMECCAALTREEYAKRPPGRRIREGMCRLLSPLL